MNIVVAILIGILSGSLAGISYYLGHKRGVKQGKLDNSYLEVYIRNREKYIRDLIKYIDKLLAEDGVEKGLLAAYGESSILRILRQAGIVKSRPGDATIENIVNINSEKEVRVSFSHTPRRLVYDEDFGFMWYNSEAPEE